MDTETNYSPTVFERVYSVYTYPYKVYKVRKRGIEGRNRGL